MHRLWVLVGVQATVAAASLVVEIVAGRMLAPYVGMSLYTWTSVIAVVLAGFSAGHWVGGRLAEWPAPKALAANGWAMIAAAVTTAGAVFLLRVTAGPVITVLDDPVAAIVALTMLVFFLPSFFAGIPAPILSQIAVDRHPDHSGRALGAMFAAGAWGAILGTLAAGFVFISWLGSIGTLVVVTGVYIAVGLYSLAQASASRTWLLQGTLAALVPALLAGATLTSPDPCTRESDYFCIRVVDASADANSPVALMVLDHLVHGISDGTDPTAMLTPHGMMQDGLARMRMDGRESWDAFIIGGGTYTVPRGWVALGEPVNVTVAEVDPIVTEVAVNDFWFDPDSARVVHADARIVLSREDTSYDLILGDAFTDIAAPPHLITREFFQLASDRMNPDGTYMMTIIDHIDRLDVLASLVVTAREVFDVVEIWADPSHDLTQDRRVFLMVAGSSASPITQITHAGPAPRRAVRVAAGAIQTIVDERRAIILTDDFAPIDRLLGSSGI